MLGLTIPQLILYPIYSARSKAINPYIYKKDPSLEVNKVFFKILRTEGLNSYQGLSIALIRRIPRYVMGFHLKEVLKKLFARPDNTMHLAPPGFLDRLSTNTVAGLVAGVTSGIISAPLFKIALLFEKNRRMVPGNASTDQAAHLVFKILKSYKPRDYFQQAAFPIVGHALSLGMWGLLFDTPLQQSNTKNLLYEGPLAVGAIMVSNYFCSIWQIIHYQLKRTPAVDGRDPGVAAPLKQKPVLELVKQTLRQEGPRFLRHASTTEIVGPVLFLIISHRFMVDSRKTSWQQ